MPNIKLSYRYRDYANYKNYGEAVFANPDDLSLKEIESALRSKCMDDEWFYTSQWGLKDLHFEKFDDEVDHPYHEFQEIETTEESPTESKTIKQFVEAIKPFRIWQ